MTSKAAITPALSPLARPRAIAEWLLAVAAIVFLMVVVGGITRLTESGLSMVRWEPVSGIIPPLDAAQWDAEFAAYKATPEYLKVNALAGMTLEQFKAIFFWEYLHRVIGRLIGLAMILPLAWFALRRAIPQGYGSRLAALAALVVLQGAIGWWMVASGLIDRPDVSHVRLAIHLLTALLFFGGLIWTALDLRALDRDPAATPARLTGFAMTALAILALQLLYGAFTAGLDAGQIGGWPLMLGQVFPDGGWLSDRSIFGNLIDAPAVVQFVHRWWAWVVVVVMALLARKARNRLPAAPLLVGAILIAQVMLGIATLLSGVAIPIAAAHQAVSVLLVGAAVACAHALGRRA